MIEILYQDKDFVAVNKPIGINTILGRDNQVEQAHEQVLVKILEQKLETKLYVVHRLDKQVSGVVVFAKNPTSHKYLNDLFSTSKVSKEYLALVYGQVINNTGVIDKPIREYGSGRMGVDYKKGKTSLTIYKIEEKTKNFTLLRIYPKTGRRHQIRVHLYSIGHSIVGDLEYGDRAKSITYPRLMLHSEKLSFINQEGTQINIIAGLEKPFLSLVKNTLV
ncbi:MAG: RNA pseudouridine synthase [Acidobacteria bacterium]|nr:RNA pseudouridine synthase [Acidobacteriota bacterium]